LSKYRNLSEIYQQFTRNLPEIYQKFTSNLPEQKYSELALDSRWMTLTRANTLIWNMKN